MVDNYFSEEIEEILLKTLFKNMNLLEVSLQRNRLTHGCLSKIKKITSRNQRKLGQDEPNRLKKEIYKLRCDYYKLEMARAELRKEQDEYDF